MPKKFTIHLQKYPFPGASFGIDQLIRLYKRESIQVVLLGNTSGFEEKFLN